MTNDIKSKISEIVDGKLTDEELEDLMGFFRVALNDSLHQTDEDFFRDLAYDMGGAVKELALLIIDFRRSMKSKIEPDIMELAEKHIPNAADQLNGIIETTEMAANKIMDNLDALQEDTQKMVNTFSAIKGGRIDVPGSNHGGLEIDASAAESISPLVTYVESSMKNNMDLISDTFVQMSFQDLTGQRIKKIMGLVYEMEDRLRNMIISFGFKLSEREKNPHLTTEELQQMIVAKESELSGPQRQGQGLDQEGIDELLAKL